MTETPHFDVVIVGTGHAGAQTAIALRKQKFEGSIALVGDEAEAPYERPPLSKEYFLGEKTFDRLLIRPDTFWEEQDIALMPGRRVVTVDPRTRRVSFADGGGLRYSHLVWATGGRVRRLSCSGSDLAGIHYVRTRADVDALLSDTGTARRAAVVGGGYIGLEAAAGLKKLGLDVTVFEAAERVLSRVAGAEVSAFYAQAHRRRGVEVLTGVSVDEILGADGRVSAVRSGGKDHPADLVVVGIGIIPEVDVLEAAGAKVENGVWVDAFGATSLPDIYAVGDCAAQESRFADGARVRIESVQNANDMGATVAASIIDQPRPHSATPWFWSNQFDLRLQTVGLSVGHDQTVLRGDPDSESFSVVYLRGGRVVALDCVNAVKDYVQGRKLVEAGAVIAPDRLADPETALKDLAA